MNLNPIEKWFKIRIEEKYRLAGIQFVYINKFGISTYVHPEKLFDIIETSVSCDAEPMLESLESKIDNVEIVLDVGANIGVVTAWFAKRAKFVHSFEPERSNAEFMRRNLRLNNISNVHIHEVAVGKTAGQADFYVRESFGHHGLQKKTHYKNI